jgi:hypothetical protein
MGGGWILSLKKITTHFFRKKNDAGFAMAKSGTQ